jgi:hypothetical protein
MKWNDKKEKVTQQNSTDSIRLFYLFIYQMREYINKKKQSYFIEWHL